VNIDPEVRIERPLSREIAKIQRWAFARPVSAKIGLPEFARINGMALVDILTAPIFPWNRETPPVAFGCRDR